MTRRGLYAVWAVAFVFSMLIAGIVVLMVWISTTGGYDCGYMDAKQGRRPDLRFWTERACDVEEWR